MKKTLKDYFPLIRGREEAVREILHNPDLAARWRQWDASWQEKFLDFLTGARGCKILYDSFFKEALNPEYDPSRIEDFLSTFLKQKVTVMQILPNDSTRISYESSLLITDIVVQLADGRIANIEIQKIGYLFPGERAACYSADLLLRQYRRARDQKKESFSYRDVKDTYVIVLFEKSPAEFTAFPGSYLHYSEQRSDTGLSLNLLQKYLFIPLDIFLNNYNNRGITDRLDAWLVFLSSDEPSDILDLLEKYPGFQRMYADIYALCRNMEDVMGIFSEELRIMDRNTVKYMMDEMQAEINEKNATISAQEDKISAQEDKISAQEDKISAQEDKIKELEQQIALLEKRL